MPIIDLISQKSNVCWRFYWMCCLILLINLICFADNLNTLLLIFCSLVSFWPYYFIFFYLKMHLILYENNMIYIEVYELTFSSFTGFLWKKPFQKEKNVFGLPWWPTFFQDLGPKTIILLLCPCPHKVGNDVGHFSYFTAYLKQ